MGLQWGMLHGLLGQNVMLDQQIILAANQQQMLDMIAAYQHQSAFVVNLNGFFDRDARILALSTDSGRNQIDLLQNPAEKENQYQDYAKRQ